MLLTSGKSLHSSLAFRVYDFFSTIYNEVHNTLIEVYHTDLTDDNAFGFTEVNGDEQLISLHDNLNETDYVVTLLHELVHVVQNLRGELDDGQRESEAYTLESILYSKFITTQDHPYLDRLKCPYSMTIQPNSQMTTNRYSMIDAFTAEEFSVLYDLVMFHDECPEWMDEAVYDKVLEKVSDVMTEFNQGVA